LSIILNRTTILWCAAVAQPALTVEIRRVFAAFTNEKFEEIPKEDFYSEIVHLRELGCLTSFKAYDGTYFSITQKGNLAIPRKLRHLRDKIRLHLLNKAQKYKNLSSREADPKGLDGDSPSLDTSTTIKRRAAKDEWPASSLAIRLWPLLFRQLVPRAGSSEASREPLFSLVSFDSWSELKWAAGDTFDDRAVSEDYRSLSALDIALMLGISHQLVVRISNSTDTFYRHFEIKKKSGGSRLISSPKVFLKVIQRLLLDYFFINLIQHDAVHSFRKGLGIVTNASPHVGMQFVGSIDIEDFFGSIKSQHIRRALERNGFEHKSAELLSNLCTLNGSLPQGAPTSPVLSNAYLFEFDESLATFCKAKTLNYTRYSDDITISGDSREAVMAALIFAGKILKDEFGLAIQKNKTRIASRSGQQRVAGVVVNHSANPPRELRRRIRAIVHNASKQTTLDDATKSRLAGFASYLNIFPSLKSGKEVEAVRSLLRNK